MLFHCSSAHEQREGGVKYFILEEGVALSQAETLQQIIEIRAHGELLRFVNSTGHLW